MSFSINTGNQVDYTTGRPAAGYDRSTDSSTSSVSAKDDLASLQARLNLIQELSYPMPQADAGVYIDRYNAIWPAPNLPYGSEASAQKKIDMTIDFAGHYPDISTHWLSFVLWTKRVPGASPQVDPSRSDIKIAASRRYNWNWDAHHNDPKVMMRISALTNLIEKIRISTNGGTVMEEADNVDLACQIRVRAQASQPTPRVHWLYAPPPLPYQTAVNDAGGNVTNDTAVRSVANPIPGFTDDYCAGGGYAGAGITTATNAGYAVPGQPAGSTTVSGLVPASADYVYSYNAPSALSNAIGSLPIQSLDIRQTGMTTMGGFTSVGHIHPSTILSSWGNTGGVISATSNSYTGTANTAVSVPDIPSTNLRLGGLGSTGVTIQPQQPLPFNSLLHPRTVIPLQGYFRPMVLDSFRERGWSGVDILDDVELMYQMCTNIQIPVSGGLANDNISGGQIGRKFKMKIPAQCMNSQPIFPDLKSLHIELSLQNVNIAFQGLGSECSYQTKKVCQNEMQLEFPAPVDWHYQLSNVQFECEVVDLAPTLRASIQKGMSEGGLPLHWTQWSFVGENVGQSENFSHVMHRNVANVIAAVSVFRSPAAYQDWRYDSYRFLNPNLRSMQWKLGTSLFPPTALEGANDFFSSFRQCFPIPADTLGRVERLDFEGERQLTIEGSFMAFNLQAAGYPTATIPSAWQKHHPNLRFGNNFGTSQPTAQTASMLQYATTVSGSGVSATGQSLGTGLVSFAPAGSLAKNNAANRGVANTTIPHGIFETMTYDPVIGGLNSYAATGTSFPWNLIQCVQPHDESGATGGTNAVRPCGPLHGNWGQNGAINSLYGLDTYCGFRGVISYRAPKDFIAARCFQTARGIDLTGISTLQGQQLRLDFTRYSGKVNLRQILLDFDPNARKVFPATIAYAGTTSSGVSSLRNLSRSLYCPFMAIWDFRIAKQGDTLVGTPAGVDVAYPQNGVATTGNLLVGWTNASGTPATSDIVSPQGTQACTPAPGVTVQQLINATNVAGSGLFGGFVDLSAMQGYCAGPNAQGLIDIPSVLQNRNMPAVNMPGVVGSVAGDNTMFEKLTSSDLTISTFILHTRVILIGLNSIQARE